jgi:uncharacterized cupin superfamily protein
MRADDVWVHVLTGEIGVLVGEETASAEPGAWALKPRGVLHAMWNCEATSSPWLRKLKERYRL